MHHCHPLKQVKSCITLGIVPLYLYWLNNRLVILQETSLTG